MTPGEAALVYAARGWQVFPLRPGMKTPATANGFKDATSDPGIIKRWWRAQPQAGVGIATGLVSGLLVLDADPPKGNAPGGAETLRELERLHGELPETAQVLTGGGGCHYYFHLNGGLQLANTTGLLGPGLDTRATGGYVAAPPTIHPSGRMYEWEIAHDLTDVPLAAPPAWLLALLKAPSAPRGKASPLGEIIPEGQRNSRMVSIAGTMRRRGLTAYEILVALQAVNKRCVPPMTDKEVAAIANSVERYKPAPVVEPEADEKRYNGLTFGKNTSSAASERYKSVNPEDAQARLAQRIRGWVEGTTGWWGTDELDKELGLFSPQQKLSRRVELHRMRQEGLVQPHQKLNKQFRYVSKAVTALDFRSAGTESIVDLKWPLQIEQFVNIYPSNLIVIAGAPNAGKTAFLLNFIRRNQDRFAIDYYCSEMTGEELRARLEKFPTMTMGDWTFNAYSRTQDFAEVLVPDTISIIDFLEITEEPWLVNTLLTDIYHKLKGGIAIVALQKKFGAAMGRGAEYSLEKPKLYIALDKAKCEIIKGKSWAKPEVNPNGLLTGFKVLYGCQIEQIGQWHWRSQPEY